MCGSHRFSEIRNGVPLMSSALLSQRLKELEEAGVVERRTHGHDRRAEYHLTDAGLELTPVIEMLGKWGHKWVQRVVRREDLDPRLLMWDVRRTVDLSALPSDRRVVVAFDLSGVPARTSRWWLVLDHGDADLCLKDPGYEVDLHVAAPLATLVDVWLGHQALATVLRTEAVHLDGPRSLVRSFGAWFRLSRYARPGGSRENDTAWT
jgi:DNA-binding HxlR family transcriptional regulator